MKKYGVRNVAELVEIFQMRQRVVSTTMEIRVLQDAIDILNNTEFMGWEDKISYEREPKPLARNSDRYKKMSPDPQPVLPEGLSEPLVPSFVRLSDDSPMHGGYRTQKEASGRWSVYRGEGYVTGPFDYADLALNWIYDALELEAKSRGDDDENKSHVV